MTVLKTIEEADDKLKNVDEAISSKLKNGESIDDQLQVKGELLKARTELIAEKLGLVRTVVMQILGLPAKMKSTKEWVVVVKKLPVTEQRLMYDAVHKAAIELATTLKMQEDLKSLES